MFPAGTLAMNIGRSYAELLEKWPRAWEKESEKWEEFDRQAFAHPDTIGRCVFVSRLGHQSVGLASYDPRPRPHYGVVGQNCVVPEFRGRGFGKRQILEILKRFIEARIGAASVTTSAHPFFIPALTMYRDLGFRETTRFPGGPDPQHLLIELEKTPLF